MLTSQSLLVKTALSVAKKWLNPYTIATLCFGMSTTNV
ncbi:hypothetical protein RNAN_2771 [Rheinheimera nanhaiensis E407-8]|uniref:Uncharacterized protein n=1 Tax=Rheinheimera nanhaiensis E407-8 TaxID=562729 RepID=I1E0D7_9GAMM|nr:hypothetical protein RNAN_2771 [Rheinheimera nanhaiensis E407-8]